MAKKKACKVIIMGAAGRDFHNFNTVFRDNDDYEVVAFTATQIPDIAGRKYPKELAGKLYPKGIPIEDEKNIEKLIKKHEIDEVVFAYSDVPHEYVMHKASMVNAAGADFKLIGANATMIESKKPVVSVCAIRTGCGKSQTTRRVCEELMKAGKKVVAIRHPMPYGDLVKQKCQRFAEIKDLDKHECTIEEREEYEPHIIRGNIIYAGVDYEEIIRNAEKEADVIVWDGGNNDTSFYKPDLEIVVVDPHRAGHETSYYPGETNLRRADVIVINKIDTAYPEDITYLREVINELNPTAMVIDGASPITVKNSEKIRGKRALVIEDGPTLTHGEMQIGAGIVAAEKYGASDIIDPRPYTVGTITATYEKYPDIGTLLPAMGYGDKQIKDLETTINNVITKGKAEVVISATPIDLSRLVKTKKPLLRVGYDLQEIGQPNIATALEPILKPKKTKAPAKRAIKKTKKTTKAKKK